MSNHESFNISHGNPELEPGDEFLLDDLERGGDARALEDLGYDVPEDVTPAANPRFTAGKRELNELHPQYAIREVESHGVDPEDLKDQPVACGDCGAPIGTCSHSRRYR